MGKIKTYLFYLLLFSCSAGLYGQNSCIETVQKMYTDEIGVRELTGHNDGKRVEEYLASCNLSKGNPWCAAFITWTFKKAGIKAVISGYSPDWFHKNVIYKRGNKNNSTPQTADVAGIWFSNMGRIAHVFFIDKWSAGSSITITVEGNTNEEGNREGDGVFRKRRLKKQIYKVSRWL